MNLLDAVFARVYDPMMSKVEQKRLHEHRRQLLGALHGDVLEVGAGTGLNLDVYPDTVGSLTLTEPAAPMMKRLQAKVAQERPDADVVLAPAEHLPFDDASFDAVVSTLVLCSVPDMDAALAELRRVLRPGGPLVLFEHVAADDPRTARMQRVFEPVQKVFGRNCHLTRDTRSAVEAAGFDASGVIGMDFKPLPAVVRTVVSGIATAPAA